MSTEEGRLVLEVREKLLNRTRTGPLAEWVERIGAIARDCSVKLEQIHWGKSPELVAHEVVVWAKLHGRLSRMAEVINA